MVIGCVQLNKQCTCIYMYACTTSHIHVHVCTDVYIHVCMYNFTYTCTCMYRCVYTCMHVQLHIYMYMYVQMCIYMYISFLFNIYPSQELLNVRDDLERQRQELTEELGRVEEQKIACLSETEETRQALVEADGHCSELQTKNSLLEGQVHVHVQCHVYTHILCRVFWV